MPSDFKHLNTRLQKQVKNADMLVMTTPVYNAGIPGLLKHLLDTFEPDSLKGKPIVIAATGGTDKHALVIDYQLRPILNYLKGVVVPSSLFVHADEFEGDIALNQNIRRRIKQIIRELKEIFPQGTIRQKCLL
jgi:NAD(P)H-dependent FMN reductase